MQTKQLLLSTKVYQTTMTTATSSMIPSVPPSTKGNALMALSNFFGMALPVPLHQKKDSRHSNANAHGTKPSESSTLCAASESNQKDQDQDFGQQQVPTNCHIKKQVSFHRYVRIFRYEAVSREYFPEVYYNRSELYQMKTEALVHMLQENKIMQQQRKQQQKTRRAARKQRLREKREQRKLQQQSNQQQNGQHSGQGQEEEEEDELIHAYTCACSTSNEPSSEKEANTTASSNSIASADDSNLKILLDREPSPTGVQDFFSFFDDSSTNKKVTSVNVTTTQT